MDVPVRCHGELLIAVEIFRSPFSVDLPCDSSRSYVDYGCKDPEGVQFGAALMAVKYKTKAFGDDSR